MTSHEANGHDTDPQLRLLFSQRIGRPSFVLDPNDLVDAEDLCPDKMGARIVRVDDTAVVKYGAGVRMAEAEAMYLIQQRTTINLPQLEAAYTLDGVTYIVMSHCKGLHLEHSWDSASPEQQARIIAQLRSYVQQMQALTGPFIGGVDYSPCRDGIFEGFAEDGSQSYGPFATEEDFNEGIVEALTRAHPTPKDAKSSSAVGDHIMKETVRALKGHDIVFCHADLHPGNMLVQKDGTLVILDWGCAGFWPSYWEFYRALFATPWLSSWELEVPKFVPPFYIERLVLSKVFTRVFS